ncbi:MAG: hypothetical protein IKB05_02900 [Alphaproteobacteria bacterium]|nr:hypothetical protein [Alphaproteobacteria bacterium]
MKKIIFLCSVCLCVPVNAAEKCVALGASYECGPTYNSDCDPMTYGQCNTADYSLDDPYGPTVDVALIGVCAIESRSDGEALHRVNTAVWNDSYEIVDAYNCWCKMIRPVISSFVYYTSYVDVENCWAVCGDACSNYLYGENALNVFFENIDNNNW